MTSKSKESTKPIKLKRKLVPAALHSELTEYSSLLRALRTNDTLDITSQLTRYHVQKGKEKETYEDEDEDEEEEEGKESENDDVEENQEDDEEPKAGPSSLKRKRSASSSVPTSAKKKKGKQKSTRETWTRWPLLAEDVPVPEWSLEDEVAHITTSLMPTSDSDSDSEADVPSSALISSLTLSSSSYLDSIFASIATIVPKRPPSMINRLAPVGWQTVLTAAQMQAAGQTGGSASTTKSLRPPAQLNNSNGAAISTEDAATSAIASTQLQYSLPFSDSMLPPSSPSPSSSMSASLDLAAHRIQTLRTSSAKLASAFSSYGASEKDLLSLDFGFPGIGFSLPGGPDSDGDSGGGLDGAADGYGLGGGWAKAWYANRIKQKEDAVRMKEREETRKRREERNKRKAEKEERDRENGRKRLLRRCPVKAEGVAVPETNGDRGDSEDGEGEDDGRPKAVKVGKRKRKRDPKEAEAEGEPNAKKKKYQSAKFIMDSDSE
ncbi:hypothetical protein BT96DRAFT_1000173 [Gymnopus androsaceus JB14]|uniref:Uncharacterized protein n=1 Tax=Gymnopus androsaceus JB14 TaxID=1447944 RepID=A0A6A4H4F1_9AGAR|nr:hypothetical protein BT96DRAFT_1000173 [Gymnopus androsaceus JB14]